MEPSWAPGAQLGFCPCPKIMFGTKLKLKIKVEYQYRYFMFGTELEIKEKYSDGRQILRTGEI